ncbi:MAG: hypothetical protein JW784_05085 [Candidatus Cloacimonetes bacterium]|nr:hypothetical protein [Candidatus Cloacimonadota bacterium]
MNLDDLNYYFNKFKFGDDSFHLLMQHRVKEILLISSVFDAYVLEWDGRLSEQISGEFRQLDLSIAPRITTITFTDDILEVLASRNFDMVIIMMRIGDVTPFDMSRQIREKFSGLPQLLLLNKQSYIDIVNQSPEKLKYFDEVFLWKGDPKLFLAMIKLVEDKLNIEHDTRYGAVRVVLIIENAITYYSSYLPMFYLESMKLTQELIEAELQEANKRLRMRARPKVLLAHDYEDALELYHKYREYIICVITNVNLPVNNIPDEAGGIKLVREIRLQNPDLPVLMQSADPYNLVEARKLKAEFHEKDSPTLMNDIRQFIINNLGFGDFVFRNSSGEEIERARSMYEFEKKIADIPEASLLFHANRNHFSAWLMAHGEFRIAQQIKYVVAADFLNTDDIRKFLINTIRQVREQRNRGKVIRFGEAGLTEEDKIIQLAEGSLGGKGRGLAFLNALLVTMDLDQEFQDISVKLPRTAIIGTNEFDNFLDRNRINIDKLIDLTDQEIEKIFLAGKLDRSLQDKLKKLLKSASFPLAVRSSGLLEDSQSQPFAGIYKTFMLPNSHPDLQVRLQQLEDAIKIILSTPFHEKPRQYIESINYKIEEEKMAVVIQEIAGSVHWDNYYFPVFSGAAQSYNFYPTSVIRHADGVAALAAGLGKAVVDGERSFRYCPRHPRINLLEPEIMVENNQRELYALELDGKTFDLSEGEMATLRRIKISRQMMNSIFLELSSVWDYEHLGFIDGRFSQGPRVLTFRNIVHYEHFKLSAILLRILEIGEMGLGVPVEIEFAVDFKITDDQYSNPVFYILQIRPLSITREHAEVNVEKLERNDLILLTDKAMGNGIIKHLTDLVFVDLKVFDNRETMEMLEEIEQINNSLKQEKREYILMGPGRWGSSDRFLGVPVNWAQINKARIIVETSFEGYVVEASQGSHFFHNLVAMNVGYFTVPYNQDDTFIDWYWLEQQKPVCKTKHFRHIRTKAPFLIKIDGRSGRAAIFKPDNRPANR